MKRSIKASGSDEYKVSVNFAGYIGADNVYYVYADSEEEAELAAIEEAKDDLEIISIDDNGDGSYTVTVGFGGFIGVEEPIEVVADSEEEAAERVYDEAEMELTAEIVDDMSDLEDWE